MGIKKSKEMKENKTPFTAYEWESICLNFDFGDHEDENVDAFDKVKNVWRCYMVSGMMTLWMDYIFVERKLDVHKLFKLYKSLTSNFYEERVTGIISVILKTDEINSKKIIFKKFTKYIKNTVASYVRCLGYHGNTVLGEWLKLEATMSATDLDKFINYKFETLDYDPDDEVYIFESWLRDNALLAEVIRGFTKLAFGMLKASVCTCVLPDVIAPPDAQRTILDVADVMFLCSNLTLNCRRIWNLRFQNIGHGNNFTMLCNNILNLGPTLIVVQEAGGNKFGIFASESWRVSSGFYGDNRSFIFQLSPEQVVMVPSGFNNNFQYHNYNIQHSQPNGFGMGGQIGFFGFWIDANFGLGSCAEFCSTFYNYTRPSSKEHFTFSILEVWTVGFDTNVNTTIEDPNALAALKRGSISTRYSQQTDFV